MQKFDSAYSLQFTNKDINNNKIISAHSSGKQVKERSVGR